jgi:hypothetical protein
MFAGLPGTPWKITEALKPIIGQSAVSNSATCRPAPLPWLTTRVLRAVIAGEPYDRTTDEWLRQPVGTMPPLRAAALKMGSNAVPVNAASSPRSSEDIHVCAQSE